LLAEAYCTMDQRDGALLALAEALAQAEKTENRYYQAELYRLKGTLTVQPGVLDDQAQVPEILQPRSCSQAEVEAETHFHRAIEIARRQGAKSLELRAVTSLARLWRQQGKKREARNRLAEIYKWFTEGFDTADLKDAKALLDELTA
jgi:predicted ATPase